MSARKLVTLAAIALVSLGANAKPDFKVPSAPPAPAEWANQCKDFDEWDKPGPPFRIFGNTYYVGTCGIASILIASDRGHALIDSGTEAGAEVVMANVARLGLRMNDVKALLMSHEHFDHVGGMARLQQFTVARLSVSAAAEPVLASGRASASDPQAAILPLMKPVSRLERVNPGDQGYAARTLLNPYFTPGHTPGAMSWSWKSCEGKVCKTIVYADSLSAISDDKFRYSAHPEYVAAFRASLAQIAALPCDILITPHPSSSKMRARILAGSLVDQNACRDYAAQQSKMLDARLAKEAAGK